MSQLFLLVLIFINARTFQSLSADGETIHNVLPDTKNVSEACNALNCITFSNCSSEPDQCFRSDTTLLFQSKEYNLEKPIVVRDIHNLSLSVINCTQSQCAATIHCQHAAGFAFVNVSFLQIRNLNLISCGFPINVTELAARATFNHSQKFLANSLSAALQIMLSFQLAIDNVKITNSKGNGLFLVNPLERSHIQNSVVAYTNYDHISKQMSGSINCKNMTVGCKGGNVWILFVDMDCSEKTEPNSAAMFAMLNTEISFGINLNNYLWGPRYAAGLGVTFSQTSFDVQFHIENSNIHDNVGDAGANIYCRMMNFVSNSSLQIVNTSLSYGNRPFIDPQYMAYWGQAPGISIDIDSKNVIMSGSLETCDRHPKLTHTNIFLNNVTMQSNLGGGMKVFLSDSGNGTVPCCFQVQIINTRIDGSYVYYYTDSDFRSSLALLIQESKESKETLLNVSLSSLTISNCHIVHTDESRELIDYPKISTILVSDASSVYFHDSIIEGNMAVGMSTLSSNLNMIGNNSFHNNSGIIGGAMSLDAYSIMYLHPHSVLRITNNSASRFGGGISINQGLIRNYVIPCSYQLLPKGDILSSKALVIMKGNSAGIAGDAIYGGDLLSCSQNAQKLIHESQRETPEEIFLTTFQLVTAPPNDSELTSVAVGLCYCTHNSKNCSISAKEISVYPGQRFTLRAVGIGYYGGTTPAVIRQTFERSTVANDSPVTLKTAEAQSLGTACGDLTFEVEAPENISDISIQLTAEGSVLPLSYSKILSVATSSCPTGFYWDKNRCMCSPVLSQLSVQCNIDNQSFYRTGTVWISFTNDSILYYEHCPSEYCKTAGVHLNASTPDNQCDSNHSGVLCGSCKEGFSIMLGSSRCALCTDKFLGLIPVFAFAGILLVVFLTVLNLTVATGTINGLIFYANIIQATRETFGLTANIMSVFIAWLNLDLGLEVCFSSKLDIYTKTFLQFIFPVYIWILVACIIVSSHYSTTIARLTGNNSVPVLATLFLLSYAKIQRAVIAALSFTLIHEEHGDSFAVWIFDGNLRFFRGKHIPLFVTSVLFTVAFILPLTLLLLSESFLQKIRHYRVVKIMTWLKPLLDAYQGPYKVVFRFWTGFMLAIRSVLLVSIALNVSGDPGINLLVIIVVTSFTVITGLFKSGGVYKNLPLNILDGFYLYNLVGFAVWTLFNRYQYNSEPEVFTENQSSASYAMLGTVAVVFSLTLLFHVCQKLNKSLTCFKLIQRKKQQDDGDWKEPFIVSPQPVSHTQVSLRELLLDETV